MFLVTILTVDDNKEVRRLIRTVLEDLVDQIFECGDGADALAAYEEHKPDLVLMDIEMPIMDGLAATRQITAAYPNSRVVIVSKYDHEKMRAAARVAGACDYVVKEDLQALRALCA
jgi:two-component system NarL family response regulator